MQLVSFNVRKFRSIKKAHKITLGRETVLVGPNNEGKSNLLRALVTAMNTLSEGIYFTVERGGRNRVPRFMARNYDWERDFPQDLQEREPSGLSEVTLEFELNSDEIVEFRREIRSNINGTLPILMKFGQARQVDVTVVKRGPGSTTLNRKTQAIARFISQRVNFQHIPAVRPASSSEAVVRRMVQRELQTLDEDPAFRAALSEIENLQQPILDRLSATIQNTLVQFLPDVTEVRLRIPNDERERALSAACEIIVNDGTPTLLQYKGDGVQSLAALGLMRHASESSAIGREAIIAIEEPESHLHPGAIHSLRGVLGELSEKHQVVVTTHNPLFVNRASISSNVVVKDGQARPAKNLDELRSTLGVRAADNLRGADLVLVVEGEDDRVALTTLLAHRSVTLRGAIQGGAFVVEPLRGAGNLSYQVGLLRTQLCSVHVFLDHDAAGKAAWEKAYGEGLLSHADTHWATCPGMAESELEDLYDSSIYANVLAAKFGVTLECPEFRSSKKWAVRLKETFTRQGKRWDDRVEAEVKLAVAEAVAASPDIAVLPARESIVDALVQAIELRLGAR